MPKSALQSLHRLRVLLLSSEFLLAIVLLANLTVIGWILLLQTYPKYITGINYYKVPIEVRVDDQSFKLEPFDSYNAVITTSEPVTVDVFDATGNPLASRIHAVQRSSGLAIDLFSEADQLQLCMVKVDVTRIFFPHPTQSNTLGKSDIEVLSSSPTKSFYVQNLPILDIYLYPGHYHSKFLPAKIEESQKVFGIYPLPCDSTDNLENIVAEVYWWANFDPAVQRQLYATKLEEVLKSREYND